MKSNKVGYLFGEGCKSISTHAFMSFATVTIVIACLVIMSSFSLIALNVNEVISALESENEIIAYVEETYTQDEARDLELDLAVIRNVASCDFVTKEEAMEEFKGNYEDQSLFDDVDSSVFRDRFVIYLEDISAIESTIEEIKNVSGIAKVSAYLEVAQGFVNVRNAMVAVSLILIVVLLIVSIFIIANTVKLATYGRKEEIAIMKMVGASDSFIRFPFLVEGCILGIIGGLVAYFIEWAVYDIVGNRVMTGMLGNLVSVIPFSQFGIVMLAVFLGVGFVVGVFGSAIAIRNYLKV